MVRFLFGISYQVIFFVKRKFLFILFIKLVSTSEGSSPLLFVVSIYQTPSNFLFSPSLGNCQNKAGSVYVFFATNFQWWTSYFEEVFHGLLQRKFNFIIPLSRKLSLPFPSSMHAGKYFSKICIDFIHIFFCPRTIVHSWSNGSRDEALWVCRYLRCHIWLLRSRIDQITLNIGMYRYLHTKHSGALWRSQLSIRASGKMLKMDVFLDFRFFPKRQFLASWDAIEPTWVTESVTLRTELTDVTLVSEDTYCRRYWWDSGDWWYSWRWC